MRRTRRLASAKKCWSQPRVCEVLGGPEASAGSGQGFCGCSYISAGPVPSVVTASTPVLCHWLSKAPCSLWRCTSLLTFTCTHLPSPILTLLILPVWVDAIPVWCAPSLQFVWTLYVHRHYVQDYFVIFTRWPAVCLLGHYCSTGLLPPRQGLLSSHWLQE